MMRWWSPEAPNGLGITSRSIRLTRCPRLASAQAVLKPEGRTEIDKIVTALTELEKQIPPDIPWVMRVDGHTDKQPIARLYKSNWELSFARALAVVRFLIAQGIPAERLAATGFGEFQPIDEREDEIGRRRNRRIELKFDQR